MKKLLLLALLLLPSTASAQCNGTFTNNTVCGNATGAKNLPRPTSPAAFLGAAGGLNGQIQYNNSGALGGLTNTETTARINAFTSVLSGSVPASGGGTSKYLRADGTFVVPPGVPANIFSATRTALKAVDTTLYTQAILTEAGREGTFVFTAGNYTTAIATDTNEGVYIKANAIAAATGAWVRQFDFLNFQSQWFGAPADYTTDSTAIINSMIAVANIQNTNSAAGKQTAAYLVIQGGVKFASQNISWLPAANWIFIRLRYFINSDTTQGASPSQFGNNEQMTLSINSGYPGDVSGGLVDEDIFQSPLHPARGTNITKNVDNSIYKHAGPTQWIQPTDGYSAKASTAFIKDENLDRFRIAYEQYGVASAFNGILFYVNTRSTLLACTGCNGAGAWGAGIPSVNTSVVHGLTSNARYLVTSLATGNAVRGDWLSGNAVPGEFLLNERAIFKASISGNTMTVASMIQGDGNIAVGQTIAEMFLNAGITAGTTITALGTGAGGVGTYTLNNAQTVAETIMVSGNVAVNAIQGGGVTNTDTTSIPIIISLKGDVITKSATFANTNTCGTLNKGATTSISDSNTATWGANIAGGGANQVLAYCNGANWTVAAK